MSKICDRSPCDRLMKALGVYIYGVLNQASLGGFVISIQETGEIGAPRQTEIEYCPFCGTRLEEINAHIIKKFTEPTRKRTKAPESF